MAPVAPVASVAADASVSTEASARPDPSRLAPPEPSCDVPTEGPSEGCGPRLSSEREGSKGPREAPSSEDEAEASKDAEPSSSQ